VGNQPIQYRKYPKTAIRHQINTSTTMNQQDTPVGHERPIKKTHTKTKRCPCGNKNISQGCPNCSAYKMVFLLTNRSSHLKITATSGKLVNPARYSFVKLNKKDPKKIFQDMLRRYEDSPLYKGSYSIYFYRNIKGKQEPIDTCLP